MRIQLTSKDRGGIAFAVLICALCLAIAFRYFHRAFPEASLDLRVDRGDSETIALRFLADRGLQPAGYRHAAIFDYSDTTKLYLERTVGLEKMNQLTSGPIHLWRWAHRWYKPQQKEEFSVDVTPSGEVVEFRHEIPEAQAGANWEQDRARALAEDFLARVAHRDMTNLEFVEASTTQEPARRDHSFIWKLKNVSLGEGTLRVLVEVTGDQIGEYREYVQVPEQWTRDYARIRSRNESLELAATVVWIALSIAMLVVLVRRLRIHDAPLRMARRMGILAAVLSLFTQWNDFSLAAFSYDTTDSYATFLASYVGLSSVTALAYGIAIAFLVAGAEPVYRDAFPGKLSFQGILSWKGVRTRSFFLANVAGLTLAFFFFAYQTIFYILANRWGAWAPSDIPFTNDLNTAVPWAGVLFMGFFPAVSEEMQFRAFAVPFLAKWTRSLPVALVVAAFSWGTLHSTYPNEPFFIRGLEVGLGGILIGVVMLRFGIAATLIWHYSVDALYTAFVLLRAPNPYLVISGALTAGVMLVPLLVALIAYLRSGTFEEEASLTNGVSSAAPPPELAPPTVDEVPRDIDYQPLSRRRIRWAVIVAAVSLAVLAIPVYRFGEGLKVGVTSTQAIRTAESYLSARGVNVAGFHHPATLFDNVSSEAVRYMLDHGRTVRHADEMYRRATQLEAWEVRFFRPEQKEEYRVLVDQSTGKVLAYHHILDENAPGASLSPEAARALAEEALVEHGDRLSDFDLQDSSGEQRKNRKDYNFVWQAKPSDPRNIAEMHYRVEADVAGDEVARFSDYFDLPEEWLRQQTATSISSIILSALTGFLAAIVLIRVLAVFISRFRSTHFPWRASLPLAVLVAAAMLLISLNGLPTSEIGYNTSIPFNTFVLDTAFAMLVGPLAAGLLAWVLIAFALSLYAEGAQVLRPANWSVWRRDAVIAAVVSLSSSTAVAHLNDVVSNWMPALFHPSVNLSPSELEKWSPAAAYFFPGLYTAILVPAGVVIAVAVWRAAWARRSWWLWLALALFVIALGPSTARSTREFAADWVLTAAGTLVTLAILLIFFRNNPLAYILDGFCIVAIPGVRDLISQDATFYRWNGLLLAGLIAAAFIGFFLPRTRSSDLHPALESERQ